MFLEDVFKSKEVVACCIVRKRPILSCSLGTTWLTLQTFLRPLEADRDKKLTKSQRIG